MFYKNWFYQNCILAAFSTKHSLAELTFLRNSVRTRGEALWNRNSSLSENRLYIIKLQNNVKTTTERLNMQVVLKNKCFGDILDLN